MILSLLVAALRRSSSLSFSFFFLPDILLEAWREERLKVMVPSKGRSAADKSKFSGIYSHNNNEIECRTRKDRTTITPAAQQKKEGRYQKDVRDDTRKECELKMARIN